MRYKWYYDGEAYTHFCVVAHMVSHVTLAANATHTVQVFSVDGDAPITLAVVQDIKTAEEAKSIAEEMMRGSVPANQRELFALSLIAFLAETFWKVQESSDDVYDEYVLTVPDIGTLYVRERAQSWLWLIDCPTLSVRQTSGTSDTLTSAKCAAVSALVSAYLTSTVTSDGNTLWKAHMAQQPAGDAPQTQPLF